MKINYNLEIGVERIVIGSEDISLICPTQYFCTACTAQSGTKKCFNSHSTKPRHKIQPQSLTGDKMPLHFPLSFFFFLLLLPLSTALLISTPAACGGTHVITHATAFFGPKPGQSNVRDVPLFAPRPQADGRYLPSSSRPIAPPPRPASPPNPPPLLPTLASALLDLLSTRRSPPEKPKSHEAAAPSFVTDAGVPPRVMREPEGRGGFSLFNACRQLSVAADLAAVKGRVAVVARGVCDFAQKVLFMQAAGAVGVIVVNASEGDEPLANMKLNDTKKDVVPITIPAVMITYKDWKQMLPCRNETKVVFTAEGEATFDIDYGRDALNWAMMRGMALWILCQCGVNVVRYKRRVSEFRARADAIAALPVETYTRAEGTDEAAEPSVEGIMAGHEKNDDRGTVLERMRLPGSEETAPEEEEDDDEEPVCAICLEEFETGQQVRLLACSHLYHRTCIDPWLQSSSNSCPLCKREVPNLPPPPAQLHYGSI